MAFTTWSDLYSKAKDALASGKIERFMISTIENRVEMKSTMGSAPNIEVFMKFLQRMASEELINDVDGQLYFTAVGGEG